MAEITIADLDQALARLAEAKANPGPDYKQIKHEVTQLRLAWRRQEEAAGRRGGMVGGDAVAGG